MATRFQTPPKSPSESWTDHVISHTSTPDRQNTHSGWSHQPLIRRMHATFGTANLHAMQTNGTCLCTPADWAWTNMCHRVQLYHVIEQTILPSNSRPIWFYPPMNLLRIVQKSCALMCACAGLCLRLFARAQLQLWISVSKNRHQMPWHQFENKFLLLLFACSLRLSLSLSRTQSTISGYIYIVGPKNTWTGHDFLASFCFGTALYFKVSIAWNRLVNVLALVNGRHIVFSRISA